jgi:fibronectin-binding autotransporter adhesin
MKTRYSRKLLSALGIALMASAGALAAQTWNVDAGGGYNNTANWTTVTVPNAEGAAAVFGNIISANRTINVDGNFTLGSILFDDNNNYTLAATTGNAITLNATGNASATITVTNAGGNHTIGSNLIFGGDPVVISVDATGGAAPLTISGNITGTGNLTKTGIGNLTLSGTTNTFTGAILVNAGLIRIDNDSRLGNLSNTVTLNGGGIGFTGAVTSNRAFTVGALGGTFDLPNTSVVTLDTASSLSGSGSLAKTGGNGTLLINSANNTYNGTLTVSNGTLTLNATQSVNGTVIASGGNTTINYSANAAAGSGTVISSAANSQIVIATGVTSFGNGSFFVGSGAALVGNQAQFAALDRNTNLSLSAGAILAGSQDGANLAVQNLGTNRDLFFGVTGLYAQTGNTIFVGSTVGATPWRGISIGVGANGTLQTANITGYSNFVLQGANGRVLTLGNGGTAGGITMNATAPISVGITGSVILNDDANSFTNVTFSASGGILTLNGTGSGSGVLGSGSNTANVSVTNGGTLNVGAVNASAPVINAGSVITQNNGAINFTANGSNFGTINNTNGTISMTTVGSSNNGTINLSGTGSLVLGNTGNNNFGVNRGNITVNSGGLLTANGTGNLATTTYGGNIVVNAGGIVQINNATALTGATNTLNGAITGVNGSGAVIRMNVNDISGINLLNQAATYAVFGANRTQAAGIQLNGGILTNDGSNRALDLANGTAVRINGPSTLSANSSSATTFNTLTVNAPVLAGSNTTYIGSLSPVEGRSQFGVVSLTNFTNTFTGQVYVMGAQTGNAAATLQILHNGTASTLGSATINLGDGTANATASPTLRLRSDNSATFANSLVVRNNGNLSIDRTGGSTTNQTLGIGNTTFNFGRSLRVQGNNTTGFALALGNTTFAGGNTLTYLNQNTAANPHTIGVGGTVQVNGSTNILTDVAGANATYITLGSLNGTGAMTFALANATGSTSNLDVTLGASSPGYNGSFSMLGGILRYNAPNAAGTGAGNRTLFVGGGTATQVVLAPTAGNSTYGKFSLDGSGAISGNLIQLGNLVRRNNTGTNPWNLRVASGAMIAQTEAGANNAVQNNTNSNNLFFGLAADMSENMTLGRSGGTTPWGGLSSDVLANRTLISGTITAAGNASQNVDYILRGFGDKALIIGSGNSNFANVVLGNNSTSSTAIIQGNVILNSGTNNFSNSTFSIAAGGTLRINQLASDGSVAFSPYLLINPGGTFDANAPADPVAGGYNNTILDIALGTVTLSNSQALVGAVNGLRDALENVGLISITIDNLAGLSNLSQTAAYVIAGGTNTQSEVLNLNGGLLTNDSTNRTLSGAGVTLNGPSTIAASWNAGSGNFLQINSPINAGNNTITIGSNLNLGGVNKLGTVIFNNTSNVTANNITGNIVVLNGATLRANFAATNGTNPLGTGTLVLGGGSASNVATLQLRGNGTGTNGNITVGNNLSLAGANNATISVDSLGASNNNNRWLLGNLTIVSGNLNVTGGNLNDLSIGTLGLVGDLFLNLASGAGNDTFTASIDGGGAPRNLTKLGPASWTISGSSTGNLSGSANLSNGAITLGAANALGNMAITFGAAGPVTLNLNASSAADGAVTASANGSASTVNYNATNAAGDNAITVSAPNSQINITSAAAGFGGDSFVLGAGTVLSGNTSHFSQLVFGGNLSAVAGSIIAGTDPTANNSIGNISSASGLIYGIGSNLATLNITLGSGSPWSGLSTDANGNRTLSTGNLTVNSDISLIGLPGRILTLGNGFATGGVEFSAAAPVNTRIIGNVTFNDDRNRFTNMTINVTGTGNRLTLTSPNAFGLSPLPAATIGSGGTLNATVGGSINAGMAVNGTTGSTMLLGAGANLGNLTTTGRIEFLTNAAAANLGLITINAGGLVFGNSSSSNAGTIEVNTRGVLDISAGAPNFNQGTINVTSGGEVIARNGLALNAGSINLGTNSVLAINTGGLNGAAPIIRGNGSITVQLADANALGGTQFTAASILPGDSIRLAADNVIGFESLTPTNVIIVGNRTQNTGITLAGGMLTGGDFVNSSQSFNSATLFNGTGIVDLGVTGGSIGAPSFVVGNTTNLGSFTVNEEIVSSGPLVFGSVSAVDNYERQGRIFLNGSLAGVTGNVTQAAGSTDIASSAINNITGLSVTGGTLTLRGDNAFVLATPISISNGTFTAARRGGTVFPDNTFVADFEVGPGGRLLWNWTESNDASVIINALGDIENDITLDGGSFAISSTAHIGAFVLPTTRDVTLGALGGTFDIGDDGASNPDVLGLVIGGDGQLQGNGTLTKAGAGRLVISGNNSGTYTGNSAILNTGQLNLTNAYALGAVNPSITVNGGRLELGADGLSLDNITLAGGTLRISGNLVGTLAGVVSALLEFGNVPSINPITFNATQTGPPAITTGLRGLTSGGAYGGNLTLLGSSLLDAGSAPFVVTGSISENGTGSLRKIGINAVTLAGNNTFTGNISIEQGIVSFGSADALPDGGAVVNVLAANAGVGFGYDAGFIPSIVVFDGNLTTPGAAGVFAIDAASWGSALDLSGSPLRLASTANGTIGTNVTVTANATANTYFFGGAAGNLTVQAVLGGNASLEMGTSGNLAAGRTILGANNTYTGATVVKLGTLELAATGAVQGSSSLELRTTSAAFAGSSLSFGSLLLDPALTYTGNAGATGNFATGATLSGGAIGWKSNQTLTQLPGVYGTTILSTLANPTLPTATNLLHFGGPLSAGNLTLSGFAITNNTVGNLTTPVAVVKSGSGSVLDMRSLLSSNYTGGLSILQGSVLVNNANQLGTGRIFITSGGSKLAVEQSMTIPNPLRSEGTQLVAVAAEVNVAANQTATISGLVDGGGMFAKTGNGTLRFLPASTPPAGSTWGMRVLAGNFVFSAPPSNATITGGLPTALWLQIGDGTATTVNVDYLSVFGVDVPQTRSGFGRFQSNVNSVANLRVDSGKVLRFFNAGTGSTVNGEVIKLGDGGILFGGSGSGTPSSGTGTVNVREGVVQWGGLFNNGNEAQDPTMTEIIVKVQAGGTAQWANLSGTQRTHVGPLFINDENLGGTARIGGMPHAGNVTWNGSLTVGGGYAGLDGSSKLVGGTTFFNPGASNAVSILSGSTLTIEAGATFNAGGANDAFTDDIDPTIHVGVDDNSGTLGITQGTKHLEYLFGPGTLNVTGNATLNVGNDSATDFAQGTVNILSGTLTNDWGSNATGTLDVAGDILMGNPDASPVPSNGNLFITGGVNASGLNLRLGTASVGGTLALANTLSVGTATTAGVLNADAVTVNAANLNNGTVTAGALTGTGGAAVLTEAAAGNLTVNGTISGFETLNLGGLVSANAISGSTFATVTTTGNVSTGSFQGTSLTVNGQLTTTGSALTTAPTLILGANSTVNKSGSGNFLVNGTLSASPGGTINVNQGTFLFATGGGSSNLLLNVSANGTAQLAGVSLLPNTVTLNGGTLFASANSTAANNVASNNGTITVSANSTLVLPDNLGGTNALKNGAGTLELQGNNTLSGTVTVDLGSLLLTTGTQLAGGIQVNSGGTLAGNGTVAGSIFNNGGIVNVGSSPGLINAGSFSQSGTGTLNIEINGAPASPSLWDRIVATGAAAVNGILNVIFDNSLVTTVGDAWKFITSGSRTGNFTTVNITAPGNLTSTDFAINYLSDGVEIARISSVVTYDTWKLTYWPSPDANDDWNDDADLDGHINLVEYAFGNNPLVPDNLPITTSVTNNAGNDYLTLTYTRPGAANVRGDLAYTVKRTTDLVGSSNMTSDAPTGVDPETVVTRSSSIYGTVNGEFLGVFVEFTTPPAP